MFVLFCATACRPAVAPQSPVVPAPAPVAVDAGTPPTVASLAAEYWNWHLEQHPIAATEIGDRRFDDRLPDLTPEAREREIAWLRAMRVRVETLPGASLPAAERVTRALLLNELDSALAFGACRLDDWAVDARDGLHVVFQRLPELQPVRTVAEGWTMVKRWQKMGMAIDQQTANLRRGLAAGKVATAEEVRRVLAQLDDLLGKRDADWPLRAPAAAAHDDWPSAERKAFAGGIDAAIAGGIRPALTRQRDMLRAEILPVARDDSRAGIKNVPGGDACYAQLIRVHTSLELSAEEIHRIGIEELTRIQGEMSKVGHEALGTGSLPEIRKRLRADKKLFFSTRDEIQAAAKKALDRAQAAQSRFLGKLPRTPCVIKAIEPFEEKDAPIAYYRPAAVDGTRPGAYYVNTSEPTTRARYEVEPLAFHESVPGHHVQIAIAQELQGMPEFRKHAGVTAFVEGWGLYSERLADELGLYSGPLDRLGRLSFEAWRAIRLVVDTGVHALGWSRTRAIAFMEESAVLGKNNVINEVDRYIAWPGQALAYKLGEREIRRLRADAEKRLGDRFNLGAFHDVVLGGGAVSLPILRDEIDAWVRAQTK
jgi:uncharacterized protein (DUF885 family)